MKINTAGMSLVEVLATCVVAGVVLITVATWMNSQHQQMARVADQVAVLDLERTVSASLASGVCDAMITTAAPITFDPTSIPVIFPAFPQIPLRSVAGSPAAVVGDGITVASPMSPRLFANSIRLADVSCAVQPCTATSDEFNANLEVQFDNTRVATPLQSMKFPVLLRTVASGPSQKIVDCKMRRSGGATTAVKRLVFSAAQSCGGGHVNCSSPSAPAIAYCPPDTEISGCGFYGGTFAPVNNGDGGVWDDYHSRTPSEVKAVVNPDGTKGCSVTAGVAPGCGVCFYPKAVCLKLQ